MVHVEQDKYFVGTSVEKLFLNSKQQVEIVDVGRADVYLQTHHVEMEQVLIDLMYRGDKSLEDVCEFIINQKGVKTKTIQLESPNAYRKSDWVSIEYEGQNAKKKVGSPTKKADKSHLKVSPKKIQ